MKILIACEESQIVLTEFLQLGHDVYSCDLIPTTGAYPERHIQGDVAPLLKKKWDMIIAFPPCTHLASSGARWFGKKRENGQQQNAIDFFMLFTSLPCPKIVIENPVGIMSIIYRRPHQIIQPWQYGHGEMKTTCLWLKGLPNLKPTNIVGGREQKMWRMPPSIDRSMLRSKTYKGVAKAMAEQWSDPDVKSLRFF